MVLTAKLAFTGVANGRPVSHIAVQTDEITTISIQAVFKARTTAVATHALERMDRRDRIVLILLDGQRTVSDVLRLLHRSEEGVSQVLVRLLKSGLIDYVGTRKI